MQRITWHSSGIWYTGRDFVHRHLDDHISVDKTNTNKGHIPAANIEQ